MPNIAGISPPGTPSAVVKARRQASRTSNSGVLQEAHEYANFEGMIAAARELAPSFRKKFDALQPSSHDMASAAR